MQNWRLFPAIAALGLRAASARAEPSSDSEGLEIVVEGTAPARSASETSRDRRVLTAAPHRTASDLMSTVPGIFVTQHSGEGKAHQIFFRGFDAVHGQDLELWVGGAPVNEVSNVHGQGYADLHFVMPEVVRELRAQGGCYDPRQGDFAVAGTLAFELGYAEPGLTAKAGFGSFGRRRLFLAYHPRETSDATFGAAEIQSADGYGAGRAMSRAAAIAQAETPLPGGFRARLLASTYAGRFGSAGVLRLDDIESGRVDRFGSYDTDQGGRSQRTAFVASLRRTSDESDFAIVPYFVQRALLLRSNFTGYLVDAVRGDSVEQLNESHTFGARGWSRRRVRLLSEQDSVEIGISLRGDFIDQSERRLSSVDDTVTRTDVDAEVRAADIAGYVDAEVHPLRRVRLRGGVRADGLSFQVRDRSENAAGARASQGTHVGSKATLEVGIFPGTVALLSYGEGFRSPQARSLGNGERTPFTTVRSQELGLRFQDDARLRARASVYRTTLSDDLVFDEATSRNLTSPGTRRIGGVLDVVAEPADWFTSALGLTYTRATFAESGGRYLEGELVPFVPELVVRSDLAVSRRIHRVGARDLTARAGIGATFVYGRPIPYGERGSNVALLDAQLAARAGEFELTLEAFNLADHEFYDGEFVYASSFERGSVASNLPVRHVTVGPPRALLLSFAITI